MRKRFWSAFVVSAFLLVGVVPAAYAALERVGPVNAGHGYPEWYQDRTGLILDFCSPSNQSELDGGWCLLLPPDPPSAPEAFPTVFSDEHFYFAADAGLPGAKLVLHLEAAFAVGPVIPGDQITFGRVRVVMGTAPASGTYIVYHPFGVMVIPDQVAGERLFFTQDIGLGCPPGAFECALTSSIGPFLLPSATPGGAELPPVPILDPTTGCAPGVCDPFWPGPATPYPGTGRKYVSDPARNGPVTGSPLPPFTSAVDGVARNHNIFRIEVLQPGAAVPTLIGETYHFALMGRIYESTVPGRVTLDRASYSRPVDGSPTGNKVDVFATALPTMQGRLPAGNAIPPFQPVLVFYDAPCGVVGPTGALTNPVDPATLLPLPSHPTFSALGSKYAVGQSYPVVIPPAVCVEQTNALDVNGFQTSVFAQAPVTDQVFITEAQYDPNTLLLCVDATSSDRLFPPVLTVGGYGVIDPVTGAWGAPIAAPPNKITVVSSAGGLNQRLVNTLYFTAPVAAIPVAINDLVTIPEDAPATVVGVLANDTLDGAAIPAGGVVNIGTPPLLGTALVNLNGTISYAPKPNANGDDVFTYTVTVNGLISNAGAVTVAITPVNDLPVAVNDAFNVIAGRPASLNVLSNDTDPDGFANLDNAVIVTPPPIASGATATGGAGGNVDFLSPAAGTYTFTYQAQDAAGALSALPATVTVRAFPGETITVTKAQFTARQSRWVVQGSVSPPASQTVTIAYADGPNAGFVIGTATANATGNWLLDSTGATGLYDPRNAGLITNRIIVTGPGGGSATATFRIK